MTQKYGPIWATIKKNSTASVTVSKELAPTLIQGVKRTKSLENTKLRWSPKPRYSKLVISKEVISSTYVKVTFTLLYESKL